MVARLCRFKSVSYTHLDVYKRQALGQRLLPGETGTLLSTIILSSGLLYEIIGPACAKASLFLSGTVSAKEKNPLSGKLPSSV